MAHAEAPSTTVPLAHPDWQAAERLVRSLQFEGYLLYPYRPSALKNRCRWAFGTLYPPELAEPLAERSQASLEVLLLSPGPALFISLYLLRAVAPPDSYDWYDLEEHRVHAELSTEHDFVKHFALEDVTRGGVGLPSLEGSLRVTTQELAPALLRLHLEVENHTCVEATTPHPNRDHAYRHSLIAAHLIAHASSGHFVSLLNPPPTLAHHAAGCVQNGLHPALVGSEQASRTLVGSPIIVGDHPRIAPESQGDYFDATEIDELLSLRILTLTPEEKAEMRASDARAARLLERTERLGEVELGALHGRTTLRLPDCRFAVGDRVRISPKPHGDVLDVALRGEAATVCAVEQDLEGRWHFAVTVDADPGSDLGQAGQVGHRFFFGADELEPIS